MRTAQSWTEASIVALRDVTPTVREFSLQPVGGARPQAPGGHLQLQLVLDGRVHTRSYSLVGQPDAQVYRIAVKRLDAGRGGSLAMWKLAPGDRLRISEPQNHFPLDLNAPAYLLVAGGIGITPMLQMAQALAARTTASGRSLRMVYAVRSEDELAYATELRGTLGERLCTFVSEHGQRIDLAGEIANLEAGGQLVVCAARP